MNIDFDYSEDHLIYEIVEDVAGDIMLTMDRDGFITQASSSISELGIELTASFILPHVTDLVQRDHAEFVGRHVRAALSGGAQEGWVEFPVAHAVADPLQTPLRPRWYALKLRPSIDTAGVVQGAVGVIRSVQQLRELEHELCAAQAKDQLTGLANRPVFHAGLQRCLNRRGEGTLGVFVVDGLYDMRLRYGQRTVDELLYGFARFLETMALPGNELACLDGERFGVFLPGVKLRAAREWSEDMVQTFQALCAAASARSPSLSLSVGLAPLEGSVEKSLREAEVSLVLARAGGGGHVAIERFCRAA